MAKYIFDTFGWGRGKEAYGAKNVNKWAKKERTTDFFRKCFARSIRSAENKTGIT